MQKNATCVGNLGEASLGKLGNGNHLIGSMVGVFQGKYCFVAGKSNFSNLDTAYDTTCEDSIHYGWNIDSLWKFRSGSFKENIPPKAWPLSHHVTLLAHGRFHYLQNLVSRNIKPISFDMAFKLLKDPHYTKQEHVWRTVWYCYLEHAQYEWYKNDVNYKLLVDKDGLILPIDEVVDMNDKDFKLINEGKFEIDNVPTPSQILAGAKCSKTNKTTTLSSIFVIFT